MNQVWNQLLQGGRRSLNELTIRGPEDAMAHFVERLKKGSWAGWERDTVSEGRLKQMGLRNLAGLCVACSATGQRPAAAIWLHARGPGELYVSNIVPKGKLDLSENEYNALLAEFASAVAQPAASGVGVQIQQVHHRAVLERELSVEAIRRLKAFSAAANMEVLHSQDSQRWYAFVVQSHLEGSRLNPLILEQWLAEQGWNARQRQELAAEYEIIRSALSAYDAESTDKCLQ